MTSMLSCGQLQHNDQMLHQSSYVYLQMTRSASAVAGFLESRSVTSSTPRNKPHPLLQTKQIRIMNNYSDNILSHN